MARERHKPEENVAKLRQVDVLTGARACVYDNVFIPYLHFRRPHQADTAESCGYFAGGADTERLLTVINPESQARRSSQAATYSLWCWSARGTRNPSSPSRASSARKAAILIAPCEGSA
jgi:hypothetical protein